jgi:hypothetical protein
VILDFQNNMRNYSHNFIFALALTLLAGVSSAGSLTTIDVPGATETFLTGISNNGVAVGYYTTSGLGPNGPVSATFGFEVLADGTLVYPFADPSDSSSSTKFLGIDSAGTIIGYYGVADGNGSFEPTPFILSGGSYNTPSVTGCDTVFELNGINDGGGLAGTCLHSAQLFGFVQMNGGSAALFSSPGVLSVLGGINNLGQSVGEYGVFGSDVGDGYIRNADGTFTIILYPGASDTAVTGINDEGVIAGYSQEPGDTSPDQAFYGTSGDLMPLIPNAEDSQASGINDFDQVVGFYFDSNGFEHAFIESAFDPEPSSMPLCGSVLMAGTLLIMRRRG